MFREPIAQSELTNRSLKIIPEEYTYWTDDNGTNVYFCSFNCMFLFVEKHYETYIFTKALPLLYRTRGNCVSADMQCENYK